MNKKIESITNRIIERSKKSRSAYLEQMEQVKKNKVFRSKLSCGNLAHALAGCDIHDKDSLKGEVKVNIGVINSYNDMLSAHKTYEKYPDIIRSAAGKVGAVAQVAGGVPAMCDGVTQGQMGMELSLMSRDVIALSTAIGLSHNMFDAAMFLGICDKIVPGMLIGALRFGHLPCVFVPGGPMSSKKSRPRARGHQLCGVEAIRSVSRRNHLNKSNCCFTIVDSMHSRKQYKPMFV